MAKKQTSKAGSGDVAKEVERILSEKGCDTEAVANAIRFLAKVLDAK